MAEKISIAGLDKAALLAALHNGTRAIGLGALHDIRRNMTADEAQTIIAKHPTDLYFDYVQGRPVKADLNGDEFDPWCYDRDAGEGAAQRAVDRVRESVGQSA